LWHRAVFGDPTYADAILDRLVHNAHRINPGRIVRLIGAVLLEQNGIRCAVPSLMSPKPSRAW
jgi:hypothetical protein